MARATSTPVAAVAAESRPGPSRRPTLSLLAISLRPEQWSKNLLLFAGLIFGGRLLEVSAVLTAMAAFAIFCALSGAVYLFNDVWDRDADRSHPLRRTRPIAAGDLGVRTALSAAAVLAAMPLAAAFLIDVLLGTVAAGYVLLLLLLYSAALKHVVIIDVLTIAGGFVLRAIAGALAVSVPIGAWLLSCTTLLALFLALSKRRHELMLLGECARGDHRRILEEYSPYLLDQMISVVTRLDAHRLCGLRHQRRHRPATGHLAAGLDDPVCAVWDLSISLPRAPEARGR